MNNTPHAIRFWSKVRITPECWLWTARHTRKGYGMFKQGSLDRLAHRVAWEEVNGPIPPGLCVLHKCDNPPCVRPDHLFLGTQADNIADRDAKGRQARGDRNGSRTHPECRTRGDEHWTRQDRIKAKANGRRGERHHAAKLTWSQVAQIRQLRSSGLTLKQLAANFGVAFQRIGEIINNKSWVIPPDGPNTTT
jgi:hypothetical protein